MTRIFVVFTIIWWIGVIVTAASASNLVYLLFAGIYLYLWICFWWFVIWAVLHFSGLRYRQMTSSIEKNEAITEALRQRKL